MATLLKKFYRIIIYIGFIFFGGGLLITFGQFIIYNGMGNFFEYSRPIKLETIVNIDSLLNDKTIYYKYFVDNKSYNSMQTVKINHIEEYSFYKTNIYYNTSIPAFSYIGSNKLKIRSMISGMLVSGFFLLFILVIYKFTNIDKWIGIYIGGKYQNQE